MQTKEKYQVELYGMVLDQIRNRIALEDEIESDMKTILKEQKMGYKKRLELYDKMTNIDRFIAQVICDYMRNTPF